MAPTNELTDRQATVLEVIARHIDDMGYPPTIRELGDNLGIRSTNGVNDHLKALERKGYLSREQGKSRTIKPLFWPDGTPYDGGRSAAADAVVEEEVRQIPLVGRIAAGTPLTAVQNQEDVLTIGERMLGRGDKEVFALEVQGDSMINDGIFDGDTIFVRRQPDARDGQIVAAMIEGEATVKRLFHMGDLIRLQPANDALEPIDIRADEARETVIIGPVVAVFRRL